MRRAAWAMPESVGVMKPAGESRMLVRSSCRAGLCAYGLGALRRLRRSRGRLPVNHPVDFAIAQDDLHVVASFGKRNGFDELGDFFIIAFGFPRGDAVFAGVERRESVLRRAGELH